MSRVDRASIIARGILLKLISSCKISHLGINPVRGGSPPSDSRVSEMIIMFGADLFHKIDSELILVEDD